MWKKASWELPLLDQKQQLWGNEAAMNPLSSFTALKEMTPFIPYRQILSQILFSISSKKLLVFLKKSICFSPLPFPNFNHLTSQLLRLLVPICVQKHFFPLLICVCFFLSVQFTGPSN